MTMPAPRPTAPAPPARRAAAARAAPGAWVAAVLLAVALALPSRARTQATGTEVRDGRGTVRVDDPVELDAIRVAGLRPPLAAFPGAVSLLDAEDLQDGQRQASLAEPLQRVPGVLALDRGNLAQDLQVQSRGFGARSTFGIRGIQLVVDGIPATALDGQGQASTFALGALDRIEVLRGPLALQYGNAAGGAIIGESRLDGSPEQRLQAWAGGDAARRVAARAEGGSTRADAAWRVHGAWFGTDGPRPHSAAERLHAGAVARWRPIDGHELRLVTDVLHQPETQDPLGLTRAQWRADPHGTDPAALAFDTRKRVDNRQAGLRWSIAHAGGHETWVAPHGVDRSITQYLAIPPAAQAAPTSGGGVIDLDRREAAIAMGHRRRIGSGAVAAGFDAGRLREHRRGHENFIGDRIGVRGRLRRDEVNTVTVRDAWLAAELRPAVDWTVLGAVRRSRLAFASRDRYVVAGNGDDSGRLSFDQTAASLGVARAFGAGEVFAGLGRGFEAPTVVELAYRPDGGGGFNPDLRPSRIATAEAGMRWRGDRWEGSLAAWRVEGRGEIVPAASAGGRTSYANAGRTSRHGLEASLEGAIGARWRYLVVGNTGRASFEDAFEVRVARGGQTQVRTVSPGTRVPGIPDIHGFAELAWHPRGPIAIALEVAGNGPIPVDDAGSDAAPGHVRMALAARWRTPRDPGWHAFVRVDNLADRDAVGSVIVNEANGRAFEPLAGRGVSLGFGWTGGR